MRKEARLQHELVDGLLFDELCVTDISAGLVGRWLRRGQKIQVVVAAVPLGAQGKIKQEAVRQHGDVIQVRESAAHAGGVDPRQGLWVILGPHALLLALLVFLDLGIEAVPLLLGHAAELYCCKPIRAKHRKQSRA